MTFKKGAFWWYIRETRRRGGKRREKFFVHMNVRFIIQEWKFFQNCSDFYCVSFSGQRKSERIERIIFTKKFPYNL